MKNAQVFWLNFDGELGRKMAGILHSMDKHDTLDELGLGRIRDFYSGKFFPGLNSLMSRARYFIFISAIYDFLYGHRKLDIRKEIKKKQDELRRRLESSYEGKAEREGIIGIISGDELQKYPDEIYWGGLRKWKVLTMDDYKIGILDAYSPDKTEFINDNKEDENIELPIWSLKATVKERFFKKNLLSLTEKIDFDLKKDEAKYLAKLVTDNFEGSILDLLIQKGRLRDEEHFWKIDGIAEKPYVRDALCFSSLGMGAWMNYYYLLIDLYGDDNGLGKQIEEKFSVWHKDFKNKYKKADVEILFENLSRNENRINGILKTKDFMLNITKAYLGKGVAREIMLSCKHLMVSREDKIKTNRAKLVMVKSGKIVEWDKQVPQNIAKSDEMYNYFYLWDKPAKRIINDIVGGMSA